MAAGRLHSAQAVLALACSLSGVAAFRGSDHDHEHTLTSQESTLDRHPRCTNTMHGSLLAPGQEGAVEDHFADVICTCGEGFEPISKQNGRVCEVPGGDPGQWRAALIEAEDRGSCMCKQQCIRRVYEAILIPKDDDTAAAVSFPKALPGLDPADINCLLDLREEVDYRHYRGGSALHFNREDYRGDGVYEELKWRGADQALNWSSGQVPLKVPIWRDVTLDPPTPVMALGDIHGRLGSLRQAWTLWNEGGMEHYVVGLGDMIDRGNRQLEVILGMIAWRAMFPHKVSFVRGNHEHPDVYSRFGFPCVDRQGPYAGMDMVSRVIAFVRSSAPVMLRIEQRDAPRATAVFMHGGFGPEVFASMKQKQRKLRKEVEGKVKDIDLRADPSDTREDVSDTEYDEIVWSEIGARCKTARQDCKNVQGEKSGEAQKDPLAMFDPNLARGKGFFFSPGALKEFLKSMKACMIVLGHSHISEIGFHPERGVPCGFPAMHSSSGFVQMVVLSAHQFRRHRKPPNPADPGNQGQIGLIHFDDKGSVTVGHRPLFEHPHPYGEVSEMLDVGTSGQEYPLSASGCHWLVPAEGFTYRCEGPEGVEEPKCPDPIDSSRVID